MKLVSVAAVVIHNMIVEHQRASYCSDGTARRSAYIESDEVLTDVFFTENCPGMTPLSSNSNVTVSDAVKVGGMHRDLLRALVKHQWQAFGKNRNIFLK